MSTRCPIIIRKYEVEDFETYYSLVSEDHVMKYITGKGLTKSEAQKKFAEIIEINKEEEELGYFKVYTENGVHMGDCKLERYDRDINLVEIGYILKEAFWGQGYGTLICESMLLLADRAVPHTDVIGIIDPENEASKKLLEKFNFQSFFVGIEDDLPTEKLRLYRK